MDTLGIRKGLLLIEVYVKWRIQGRGPGGPAPPLIFGPNWGPKSRKHFLGSTGPPLSQGLDDRPRLLSEGLDFLVMYVAGTMIKCPPTAGFTVIFNDNNNIYCRDLYCANINQEKKIHLRITLTQPNRKILVHNNSNSKNSKNNN